MTIFQCQWCPFEAEYDNPPLACPKCESRFYGLIYGKGKKMWPEDSPRWSDALGVNPDQIPAFKKKFGDLMEFAPDGRCLVKNRQHKKALLKARGFAELD